MRKSFVHVKGPNERFRLVWPRDLHEGWSGSRIGPVICTKDPEAGRQYSAYISPARRGTSVRLAGPGSGQAQASS